MGASISGRPGLAHAVRAGPADPDTSRGPPGPGAAPSRPGDVRLRIPHRSPATRQLLGRLRDELGRIARAPASPAEALREIADAMARAALGGWSLPGLDAPGHLRHDDGSISIALISHVIVLNPWGAFRIVDCLQPVPVYFEMPGLLGEKSGTPAPSPAGAGLGGGATQGIGGPRWPPSPPSPPSPSGGRRFVLPALGAGGASVARIGCDGLRVVRSAASLRDTSLRVPPGTPPDIGER